VTMPILKATLFIIS